MSIIVTPARRRADAKEAYAVVLVLVAMCLAGLVLTLACEPFANAIQLAGQLS
jgi:hypothetical protein